MTKFPFDDYADKELENSGLLFRTEIRCLEDVERIDWENSMATIAKRELRRMLVEAWLAGLKFGRNSVMDKLKDCK